MVSPVETVNISDFRANLLKYLEKASAGQQIIVTTNGRVLATISPPIQLRETARSQLAGLAATAKIHDVTSPIKVDWDAAS
ncbi:MAG: type II toxin-antitoxin system prevent-host-death family antitoxin [Cellvibrionaceae bacterium]